ncbi:MAG: hypothetical protein II162_04425, partial [Clostridia bacterium]|nr:hypothetical protein [Clostridia bacterium]
MVLAVNGNTYAYELEKLTSCFFPEEHVTVLIDGLLKDGSEPGDEVLKDAGKVTVEVSKGDVTTVTVFYEADGQTVCELTDCGDFNDMSFADSADSTELRCAQLLYKVLSKVTGLDLGWGILTGIRPSKLLLRLIADKGEEKGLS